MEVKVMIDLGFVKKDALQNVHDVKMVRGLGRGISHHPVVLCSVELVGTCMKRKKMNVFGMRC